VPFFGKKDDHEVKRDIADAFQALLGADSKEKKKKIVKDNRQLLFSDTARHFIQLSVEKNADNPDFVQILLEYRNLLRGCESKGIDRAFEEDADTPVEIAEAVKKLFGAWSWEGRKRIIVANRGLLLSQAALSYLLEFTVGNEINSESVQKSQELWNLLRSCRKRGIDATFALLESDK
jgi:hypothetical protein